MTILLPQLDVTINTRVIALLEANPLAVVGSFWIMGKYGGFGTKDIPSWWINIVDDNPAQYILDCINKGYIVQDYVDPLYYGFCILVIADSCNLANFSYMIQHIRMTEGIDILELMAKHNIPAVTDVYYPADFLAIRYGKKSPTYQHLKGNIESWSVQVWEDYCGYLMGEKGQDMLTDYYLKLIKDYD